MEKPEVIKLSSCKKVIQNNSRKLFGSFFLFERQQDQETYPDVKSAIKAYLKVGNTKDGDILIYRSEHLNPQIGGWYNPDRLDRYSRVVYSVTFDQLLRISDLEAGKFITVELLQVTKGKAKVVSYDTLLRTWWKSISPVVKKQWLEKLLEEMLFEKVLKNPRKFLEFLK